MKVSTLVISSVIAISSQVTFSAEVDQFTLRDHPLKDSSKLLNSKTNNAFKIALIEANSKGEACDEKILYKALRGYFNNHIQGKLTKDILADKNITKRFVKLTDSVYQDWNIWDGIGMGSRALSRKAATMSGEMRLGDQFIGVDKLEHMWGQGYSYFKINYIEKKGVVKAVKIGAAREKIYLGGNKLANGVFSYGDLGANFNGMRFWNHMLLKHDDVLGADRNIGPYVSCLNNSWTQVEEIDLKNYIDDSMDESINCSKFPTQKTADKFEKRLKLLGMTCPVDVQKRDDLIVKYRQMAKWMINSDGLGKVKYTGEFKNN